LLKFKWKEAGPIKESDGGSKPRGGKTGTVSITKLGGQGEGGRPPSTEEKAALKGACLQQVRV